MAPRHITELEFWSSKQRDVKAVQNRSTPQATGLSTALMSLMNAPRDSQTGKINVKISHDVESQIFAETLGLRELYAATVPHRRTRAEFFGEFFKMLTARVERRRKKANGATRRLRTLYYLDVHAR